jgi:hypothetical protein
MMVRHGPRAIGAYRIISVIHYSAGEEEAISMAEQSSPRRPISAKAAGLRRVAQSPEYQREVEKTRQAAAEAAEAQQDVITALEAAGISVAPQRPFANPTAVGFSCSAETARTLASWVRQHTDGGR